MFDPDNLCWNTNSDLKICRADMVLDWELSVQVCQASLMSQGRADHDFYLSREREHDCLFVAQFSPEMMARPFVRLPYYVLPGYCQ